MNENLIQFIQVKNNSRLFFVGDIHGMFLELEKLLISANFDKSKDILIATGDLIDRGSHSHLALYYLNQPWFFTVYGNHEELLITEHSIQDNPYWKRNGGCWDTGELSYTDFVIPFLNLPYIIEVSYSDKTIGVVHAGVPYQINDWKILKSKLNNTNIQNQCIWDRTRFNYKNNSDSVSNIDLVISGHSIVKQISKFENHLFIDTGGFYLDEKYSGGFDTERYKLTMIELTDNLNYIEY